ncbi:MAG: MAPEG family protein [Paraburkholderia sp.]|nr:MAPEG family protein [Paraburkholderia sp.]
MNSTALACTAALGLLLFVLGFGVSILRSRVGVLSGYASEPDHLLTKLVRAHGNTAEYVPFLAVLCLYLGSEHPPHWQLWCMVGATACRLLLVVALIAWPSMQKPNPARAIGALGTYAFGAGLCVALFTGH